MRNIFPNKKNKVWQRIRKVANGDSWFFILEFDRQISYTFIFAAKLRQDFVHFLPQKNIKEVLKKLCEVFFQIKNKLCQRIRDALQTEIRGFSSWFSIDKSHTHLFLRHNSSKILYTFFHRRKSPFRRGQLFKGSKRRNRDLSVAGGKVLFSSHSRSRVFRSQSDAGRYSRCKTYPVTLYQLKRLRFAELRATKFSTRISKSGRIDNQLPRKVISGHFYSTVIETIFAPGRKSEPWSPPLKVPREPWIDKSPFCPSFYSIQN